MTKQFIVIALLGRRDLKKSKAVDRLKENLPQPCRWVMRDDSSSHIILTCQSEFKAEKINQITRDYIGHFAQDMVVLSIDDYSSMFNISPMSLPEEQISVSEIFEKKRKLRSLQKPKQRKPKFTKKQQAEIMKVFGSRKRL